MPITKQNIQRHELIGLNAEISAAKNKCNLGLKGKIVNETYHTLQIKTKNKVKRLFKKNITLKITLPSKEKVEINGEEIEKRPWDRLKIKK